jgi:hypothetical protein
MASIIKTIELDVGGDVGAADKAFPGVLTDSRLDGEVRTVTFANGMVVKERIVDIDEAARRVAYAVIDGRFSHHNASMQVLARGEGACGVVWTSDLLPDDAAPMVRDLVEQGALALRGAAAKRR